MTTSRTPTKAVADTNLTDDEKHVLEAIVVTLNIMADENELSGRVQDVPHPLLVSSWKYSGCEMRSYLNRLRKWLQTGTSTFVMACALMKRLDEQNLLPAFTQHSIHQVFLICVVTCIKCHEDVTLSNAGFAKVGGVSVDDLNAMERYVVYSLNWKLQTPHADYESMERDILHVADFLRHGENSTSLAAMVPITFCGLVDTVQPEPIVCDPMILDMMDESSLAVGPSLKRRISRKMSLLAQKPRIQSFRNLMGKNESAVPMQAVVFPVSRMSRQDSC